MTNEEILKSFLDKENHPFYELADEILNRYCEIYNENKLPSQERLWSGCCFEEICNEHVHYEGAETWRFGGYEKHYISIPLKFFTDTENAFISFEAELLGIKEVDVIKRKMQKEEKDLLELERLKALYEDN